MASKTDLAAAGRTTGRGRIADVLLTAVEWQREQEKWAVANPPPTPKRPPP